MQVPGASTTGVKFDQFPGAPGVSDGRYAVFKGNYTDGTNSRTGVYFRDMQGSTSPVRLIADRTTIIPGGSVPFGSTAPPSAAAGQVAFLGLDNEDAPTAGGIYVAPLAERPALRAVVRIGTSVVPDAAGNPLPDAPVFTRLGESLAFDGRYVAFRGAWNTADPARWRERTLTCPSDGSPTLVAACLTQYPSGSTTVLDPLDQGIFVADTVSGAGRLLDSARRSRPPAGARGTRGGPIDLGPSSLRLPINGARAARVPPTTARPRLSGRRPMPEASGASPGAARASDPHDRLGGIRGRLFR